MRRNEDAMSTVDPQSASPIPDALAVLDWHEITC